MHQGADDEHRSDDAHRDVPGDDFLPEHICQAQQQGDGAYFADGAQSERGIGAQQHLSGVGQLLKHFGIACLDGFLHDGQRGGTRLSVHISAESQLSGQRPGGHLCGERYQQEAAAHECGVEGVVAQPAEGHLADADGNQRTDDDNPDGEVRRKVESQQQARQYG